MSMTPEVRSVLLKVRDEILTGPETWFKCGLFPNSAATVRGALCLGNALSHASDSPLYDGELAALGFAEYSDLFAWNDAAERTFADVRALLDHTLADEVTT